MKKIISSIVLGFAVLSFAPFSYGQMQISGQYSAVETAPQITRIATKPSPSFNQLGVAPAMMFPPCQSPSGLVLLTMATNEQESAVMEQNPALPSLDGKQTFPQEAHSQTLIVYPLTKDGPAQQPCTIQQAKFSVYEPAPGSLLSAFPQA
jgi:hypothetical protein